jgi:hypothetical protein
MASRRVLWFSLRSCLANWLNRRSERHCRFEELVGLKLRLNVNDCDTAQVDPCKFCTLPSVGANLRADTEAPSATGHRVGPLIPSRAIVGRARKLRQFKRRARPFHRAGSESAHHCLRLLPDVPARVLQFLRVFAWRWRMMLVRDLRDESDPSGSTRAESAITRIGSCTPQWIKSEKPYLTGCPPPCNHL